MKVYLAGNPKTHMEDLTTLRQLIREQGHEITCDWLAEFEKPRLEAGDNRIWAAQRQDLASKDLAGVRACDVFVLLDADQGWGMYTEFGYALGLGKRVLVVDPQYLQVFFHHPLVTVTTGEQAPDRLGDLATLLELQQEEA